MYTVGGLLYSALQNFALLDVEREFDKAVDTDIITLRCQQEKNIQYQTASRQITMPASVYSENTSKSYSNMTGKR